MRRATLVLLFAAAASGQDGPPPGKPSLRERAAKGDPEAQFNLAKNLETGRAGYRKDFREAEKWYRQAAEQGDPYAQASLGILYRFGKGNVPQDLPQALLWFTLAADRTQGADRESIVELRDAAAARLSPEQIAESTRRAKEWQPRKAQ